MVKDEIITFQLTQINDKLMEIKSELTAGHARMDDHNERIIALEYSKKTTNKTFAVVWAVSILALGAFMNAYFKVKYLKPEKVSSPVQTEQAR